MSEDEEIIHTVLENFTCEDPADPNDPNAWHFTDKEVRSMLGICIETVRERMLDPTEVGEKIVWLCTQRDRFEELYHREHLQALQKVAEIQSRLVTEQKCRQEERDHWLRELDQVRAERNFYKQERDEAFAAADARTKQWAQTVAISDVQRREYAKLKMKTDTLHETSMKLRNALVKCSQVGWPVDVQQAFYEWQGLLVAPEPHIMLQEDENDG